MGDNPWLRVTEADGSVWVSAEAFDEVLAAMVDLIDEWGEDHDPFWDVARVVIAKAKAM